MTKSERNFLVIEVTNILKEEYRELARRGCKLQRQDFMSLLGQIIDQKVPLEEKPGFRAEVSKALAGEGVNPLKPVGPASIMGHQGLLFRL